MTEKFGIVEVQVGYWKDGSFPNPAEFVGRMVRFEGNLVYQVNTGYETQRLYHCPEGFRVHENDDRIDNDDGSYELYPARGGGYPPEEHGYYTEDGLLEAWPGLARAVGIGGSG